MSKYKLLNDYKTNLPYAVFIKETNSKVPFAEDNTDYQTYLEWLAEGNTPEPADEGQQ